LQNKYKKIINVSIELHDKGFRCIFKANKDVKISSNIFKNLKDEINAINNKNLQISFTYVSKETAISKFKNNKYKLIQIREAKYNKIPVITIGKNFIDIRDSNFDKRFSNLKWFDFTNVSTILHKKYNDKLTVIDGWAAENENDFANINDHFTKQTFEDHRKIGQDLELFCFDKNIGQGLPI
jgi:threonyl-tRNA synthetase